MNFDQAVFAQEKAHAIGSSAGCDFDRTVLNYYPTVSPQSQGKYVKESNELLPSFDRIVTEVYKYALKYAEAGLSVIPVRTDGTKKPALKSWKEYQNVRASDDELMEWFDEKRYGIGIVCGTISGNLERIDIDDASLLEEYKSLVDEADPTLWNKLVIDATPRPGFGLLYRCLKIEGNRELAKRSSKEPPVIETRGEGGYFIAPGSPRECHPKNKEYRTNQGGYENIKEITIEQREILFDCAKSFDERIPTVDQARELSNLKTSNPELDRLTSQIDPVSLLQAKGYKCFGKSRVGTRWGYAGSNRPSGTLFNDTRIYKNFSTNDPHLETEAYSPLRLDATFHHKGDCKAAWRALTKDKDRPQTDGGFTVLNLGQVEAEEISWLFYPYVALGKLTLLAGQAGLGKSWLTLAIAALVSRGKGLLGEGNQDTCNVLICSAEDGISDTIKQRLSSFDCDESRISAIKERFVLDTPSLAKLEEAIFSVSAKLVIIDPIVAFVGANRDINKANVVRQVLSSLADIAERNRCSILIVAHFNKDSKNTRVTERIVGSVDFIAGVRSVLAVGIDPNNPNNRIVTHAKSNLAPTGESILYSLTPENGFQWIGKSVITADEMLTDNDNSIDREMIETLESYGGRMLSVKFFEVLEGLGYSKHQVNERLKSTNKKVHIKSKYLPNSAEQGKLAWYKVLEGYEPKTIIGEI